ncbi:MAG: S8 family serine peptidase [Deltaproteobacteria bacterium]|nr:S8 family serine peptidase [Deltaproteobacteria bacterium]
MGLFFASAVASAVIAASPALSGSALTTSTYSVPVKRVPGRALIKLHSTSKAAAAVVDDAALKDLSARSGLTVTLVRPSVLGWLIVEVREGAGVPDEARTLEMIEVLGKDAAVAAVSENKWMRAFATANDPGRGQEWHLDVIGINEAWDVTQGLSTQRIGVVDTGLVRGHEDMQGKVAGGFDFISNGGSAVDGDGRDAQFQDPGDDPNGDRDSFHGTHVAGTIAAATNNGVGISGVNRNAQLMIVRALGFGGGDLVDIMEGAFWLAGGQVNGVPDVGANRVSVMNLSLGSASTCSSFEQDVITEIDNAGVVFVAAAGNDSGPVGSPANCTGVVSVAAHGQTLALAPYSSFGSQIDIVAPGGDQQNFGQAGGVLSSIGPDSNSYGFFEGTSMAAPHVAGVISLLQAIDPSTNRAKAEQLLTTTGVDCNSCQGKKAMNANAAVRAVVVTDPVDPPVDPVDPPVDPVDPPAGDDNLEENDDPASARGLVCNGSRSLVALPRDQDWFNVSVAPGTMTITLEAGTPDLDLYLVQNGNIVGESETGTGDEAVNVDITRSQVLQVLVNPFDDTTNGIAHTGPYTLSLTCTPGEAIPVEPEPVDPGPIEDDADEPNDAVDTAVELFCAQDVEDLTLTDDDWFFVEVRDGDTLAIEKDGAGDAELAIVDGDGVVLNSGTAGAEARDLPAGRYLIHIPVTAVASAYELRVNCLTPSEDTPSVSGGCASTGATSTPSSLLGLGLLLLLRRRRR